MLGASEFKGVLNVLLLSTVRNVCISRNDMQIFMNEKLWLFLFEIKLSVGKKNSKYIHDVL